MTDSSSYTKSYLTFTLGDELFALSALKVLEIIEFPDVTFVPNSPQNLLGLINLRGEVLPLIDTRQHFNMPKEDDYSQKSVTILELQIEGEQVKVGSVMDEVLNVLEVRPDEVKLPAFKETEYKTEFICGTFEYKDQLYRMIDTDKVFSVEEITLTKNDN